MQCVQVGAWLDALETLALVEPVRHRRVADDVAGSGEHFGSSFGRHPPADLGDDLAKIGFDVAPQPGEDLGDIGRSIRRCCSQAFGLIPHVVHLGQALDDQLAGSFADGEVRHELLDELVALTEVEGTVADHPHELEQGAVLVLQPVEGVGRCLASAHAPQVPGMGPAMPDAAQDRCRCRGRTAA